MTHGSEVAGRSDPYEFNRFISAQEGIYDRVLAELRGGQKRTHWMWYMATGVTHLKARCQGKKSTL